MESPISTAIQEISKLPGIGRKSAQRIVSHLVRASQEKVEVLTQAILLARKAVQLCPECGILHDHIECKICASPKRDKSIICVVADSKDVDSIESASVFNGAYHVLGGLISPMNGVGPEQLPISKLIDRVRSDKVQEVILALPPTMEGDTTGFYIGRLLKTCENLNISVLSRGIPIGSSLEYVDEITLGRSLTCRSTYDVDRAA